MKPANQNEMDVLLRSLALRDAGVVSAPLDAEHLDADELNSFAEGIVTERARARHSAHLAECANCRAIVVNLTQSAGFAPPRRVQEVTPATSFWQQIGGFLSYPILRFVIPAIVLASIIGIGVIALREDGPGDFVAQHEPSQQPNLNQANQVIPSESPSPAELNRAPASSTQPVSGSSPAEARRGESAGSVAGVGTSEGPTVLRKQADDQSSQATPTFAPDLSAPATAPPPAPVNAERDRAQSLSRQEAAKREVQSEQYAARPQANDSVARNKAATTAGAAANETKQSKLPGLMREGREYEDKDKNKSDTSERADSRTVSGKRFVRQNNSWIDAAYQGSRATTNVKRGSEQYRALIADEPSLRTFAEQLGGEVVVVWKGRAYRFY
jgi:hypothetical protein